MSTISASTTSTTAFKVTSDTTGTLVFQTGASPTTAMTISSSQIISFTNPPTATGGGSVSTNTAYGTSALAANTTGTFSTAVGYEAGKANTNGYSITAVGARAGWVVNGATNFTAVGTDSGRTSTTAASASFFGANSGFSNTTGSYLVAVGDGALYSNTTASNNTAVGYQAGYAVTTGAFNTYLGGGAAVAATTGTRNTFIGYGSGNAITTGDRTTILGRFNGNDYGLDIRTASNYIVLSDGDGNPRLISNGSGFFGLGCLPAAIGGDLDIIANQNGLGIGYSTSVYRRIVVQSSGNTAFISSGNTASLSSAGAWTNASDARLKKNITDIKYGLSTVLATQPKSYQRNDVEGHYIGFIAQELKEQVPEVVFGSDDEQYTVDYGSLVAVAFKAIQELNAQQAALKAEFDAYKEAHP